MESSWQDQPPGDVLVNCEVHGDPLSIVRRPWSLDVCIDQSGELEAGALESNSTFKSFILERREGCAGRTRTGGWSASDRLELGACHGFADELSSPLHHFPDL